MKKPVAVLPILVVLSGLVSSASAEPLDPPMPPESEHGGRTAEIVPQTAWRPRDVVIPSNPVFNKQQHPPGDLWTLSRLEETAMANNPTLNELAMRVRAARGEHLQAGLYPNPVVGYSGDEIGQEGRAGQQVRSSTKRSSPGVSCD